ncbi:MAG: DUF697 domain-containing protein [Bacteroidota bacterium]
MRNNNILFWGLLGSGLLFVLLLIIIGNILTIGDSIAEIHPYLSYAFYLVTALLLFFLIIRPLFSVFSLPEIRAGQFLDEDMSDPGSKVARKVAKQLVSQGQLELAEKNELNQLLKSNQDPSEALGRIFDGRLDRMDDIIHRHAKQVFISTALSQNGRLDAILVLMINFRMMKELVRNYGYRPTYGQLVKTYTKVLAAALIADGIEDAQLAEIFPQISRGFLGVIPGLGTISSSILQGTGNAFLTLRVGYITKGYYAMAGQGLSRRELRVSANKMAIKKLSLIVRESLLVFPREAQRKAREVLKFV